MPISPIVQHFLAHYIQTDIGELVCAYASQKVLVLPEYLINFLTH